jgi:Zn-dependent peptidase ImmA (M78 family)
MTPSPNNRYSLLATLRDLIPKRPLYYGEAVRLTELQAAVLRRELGITTPELPEEAITSIPRIKVVEIDNLPSSGTSQWSSGTWIIGIDADEPWQRQRFTTAHELWHVINYPTEQWLCTPGPFRSPSEKRELLADYFAGCLLMPKAHIKLLAGQSYPVGEIADTFGVSERAVRFRLGQLKFTDRRPRCPGPNPSDIFLKQWRYACPPLDKEVTA